MRSVRGPGDGDLGAYRTSAWLARRQDHDRPARRRRNAGGREPVTRRPPSTTTSTSRSSTTSPTACTTWTGSRRIQYWNHGAERITGYAADEVVGRRCADNILAHVDGAGAAALPHRLPAGRRPSVMTHPARPRCGCATTMAIASRCVSGPHRSMTPMGTSAGPSRSSTMRRDWSMRVERRPAQATMP